MVTVTFDEVHMATIGDPRNSAPYRRVVSITFL